MWKEEVRKKKSMTVLSVISAVMLISIVFCQVKSLFISMDVDEEYVIAMYYRLAKGDVILKSMWESHQFSSIMCGWFIAIYINIIGSTKGIVFFMRLFGIFISFIVSIMAFKAIRVCKMWGGAQWACMLSAIVFLYNPKRMLCPEWANFVVWGIIISIAAIALYQSTRKYKYVIICGGGATFMALAFWSSAIVVPFLLVALYAVDRKLERKGIIALAKMFFAFAIIPISSLLLFGIYLFLNIDIQTILYNIKFISGTGIYMHDLWGNCLRILGGILNILTSSVNVLFVSIIFVLTVNIIRRNIIQIVGFVGNVLCMFSLLTLLREVGVGFKMGHQWLMTSYFLISVTALYFCFVYWKKVKLIFLVGWLPTFATWLVTSIISCVDFSYGLMYLFPNTVCSLLLIFICYENEENKIFITKGLLVKSLIVFLLLNLVVVKGWCVRTTGTVRGSIKDYKWRQVTQGPAVGIFIMEDEWEHYNKNLELMRKISDENAQKKILYFGYNELVYLMGDYQVSTPSTTIGYHSFNVLDEYYKCNTEKSPQIILLEKEYEDYMAGVVRNRICEYFGKNICNVYETDNLWIFELLN